MVRVEYRFAHVVISDLTDDHLTLVLVHWDGERMRVATGVPSIPRLKESIGGLKKAVRKLSRLAERSKGPGALHEVLRVTDGPAERSLFWTAVRSEEVDDADRHFDGLRGRLDLRRTDQVRRNAWPKRGYWKKGGVPAKA